MAFAIESIDLTSVDPETGLNLTAAVYRVDGIDRQLSIGELAMVICLAQAVKREDEVTAIMAEMNQTTYRLEQMATLEDKLTELRTSSSDDISSSISTIGLSTSDFNDYEKWSVWLNTITVNDTTLVNFESLGLSADAASYTVDQIDTIITAMESKMDELNTFSQEKMIELQSATNKRDQAYDLASAMLKSFNTVLTGIASNY